MGSLGLLVAVAGWLLPVAVVKDGCRLLTVVELEWYMVAFSGCWLFLRAEAPGFGVMAGGLWLLVAVDGW